MTITLDLLPAWPCPLRDLPALLLSLSTITLGFIAVARRNPATSRASSFVFDAASFSCIHLSSNLLSISLSPFSSTQPLLSTTNPAALPPDANDDDDQYPRSPTSTGAPAPSVTSPPSSSPSRPLPLASSLSPTATPPPTTPPPSSSTLPPFPASSPPPTSSPSPFPPSLPSDHRLPTSPSPLLLLPRNPQPRANRGDPYF